MRAATAMAALAVLGTGAARVIDNRSGTTVRTVSSPSTTPVPSSMSAMSVPTTSASTATSRFDAAALSFVTPSKGWAVVQYCSSACSATLEATDDGGSTWRILPGPSPAVGGIQFVSSSEGYVWVRPDFGGEAGRLPRVPGTPTLYVTRDAGASWEPTNVVEPVSALVAGAGEDLALVGSCSSTDQATCSFHMMASGDRGRSWSGRSLVVTGTVPLIERFGSSAWVYAGAWGDKASQLWSSADDGSNWDSRPLPAECTNALWGLDLSAVSSQNVWLACPGQPSAGSQGKAVFRSGDAGQHWRIVASNGFGDASSAVGSIGTSGYVGQLFATSDRDAWMTQSRGAAVVSHDGGASWRDAPGLPPPEVFFADLQFFDRLHGWAAVQGTDDASGLYRTVDGGRTWKRSVFAAGPARVDLALVKWDAVRFPMDCGSFGTKLLQVVMTNPVPAVHLAVVMVACDAGAGSPPRSIYVYDRADSPTTPHLSQTLSQDGPDRITSAVTANGPDVATSGATYSSTNVPRCCPDGTFSARWSWTDQAYGRVP